MNTNALQLLDCFEVIINFHFGRVDRSTIENLAPCALEEITPEILVSMANDFGLVAQIGELDPSSLKADNLLPCIVVDHGLVRVMTKIVEGEPTYYDPKRGEDDTFAVFSPSSIVLLFTKKKDAEVVLATSHNAKEWFWQYFKAEWHAFAEVGALTFLINFMVLAVPFFTMNVYDRVIPNFATDTLTVLALGVGLFLLFDMFFKSVRVYIMEGISKKIALKLEGELMKKLLNLQAGEDKLLTGSKANLFKEIAVVSDFFASKTILPILDFPFFIAILIVIWMISGAVAVVVISGGILIFLINYFLHFPIARIHKEMFKKEQNKQNFIFETIKGVETLKLSNATGSRLFKWENLSGFFARMSTDIQFYNNMITNGSYLLMQLMTVTVIIVGVYEIHANNISTGALIALSILTGRAVVPVVSLSSMINKIKEFNEVLVAIDKYWHLPLETDQKVQVGLGKLQGMIEFDHVNFAYHGASIPSLSNVSLKIQPGEKIGIIGKTGAGKSTLMRLLTALDKPTSGSIYIDGHEMSTIHPYELRQNIGVMTQEPVLFAGTLADNIELARPVGKEVLVKLIKMTGLEELLRKTGQGESYYVGEGGNRLSVGQRHLVALARALIHDPSILILDEPTTGMDVGLERELIDHLRPIVENKTLIVVTHRFAALDLVDRIIVINEGQIVADGEKNKILALLGQKPISPSSGEHS